MLTRLASEIGERAAARWGPGPSQGRLPLSSASKCGKSPLRVSIPQSLTPALITAALNRSVWVDRPRGHESPLAPAADTEPVGIGQASFDRGVHGRHDVGIVAAADVTSDPRGELVSVAQPASRVWSQHRVAGGGQPLHPVLGLEVAASIPPPVGTTMNEHDGGVWTGGGVGRIDEQPVELEPIRRRPSEFLLAAEPYTAQRLVMAAEAAQLGGRTGPHLDRLLTVAARHRDHGSPLVPDNRRFRPPPRGGDLKRRPSPARRHNFQAAIQAAGKPNHYRLGMGGDDSQPARFLARLRRHDVWRRAGGID